jgi:hypothetical protein
MRLIKNGKFWIVTCPVFPDPAWTTPPASAGSGIVTL